MQQRCSKDGGNIIVILNVSTGTLHFNNIKRSHALQPTDKNCNI